MFCVSKGRGVTLRHFRMTSTCGGLQELPPIDQNLKYDFNFQQTNILTSQVNVLPVSATIANDVMLTMF